jgi:hypothetical protein
MRNPIHALLLAAALTTTLAATARAQGVLDRVVGPDSVGAPLTITKLDKQTVGQLAMAVGVPMGLEGTTGAAPRVGPIPATGRKLREVLDAIVGTDPRYEWREDRGVVVFRPPLAWADVTGVLDRRVEAVKRDDLHSADALNLIARLLGVDEPPGLGVDTKRFSLALPEGRIVLDVLNAIVREHGTLSWALEHEDADRGGNVNVPLTVSLFIGASGVGKGIPAGAFEAGPLPIGSATSRSHVTDRTQVPLLDRIVGPGLEGRPLVLGGSLPFNIARLADAAKVPMGVETSLEKLPPVVDPGFQGFTVTGLPLRGVLRLLTGLDPRYEWREMDGVIVFRPATAWFDGADPLFRPVKNVKLDDVSGSKAVAVVFSQLGVREETHIEFPETRHVSIDLTPS